MPKNIVLCSDGTGNSGGKGNDTNVWRIYKSVDLHGYKTTQRHPPNEQRAFYDDGVGTERMKLLRIFCGAFGYGLSRNVKQLYARLVVNFEPGDNIYLFGFSRGAFTVRTLAGFITACGVIDKKHCPDDETLHTLVNKAYRAYRRAYAAKISTTWCRLEKRFGVQRPVVEEFRKEYSVRVQPDQYADHRQVSKDFAEAHIVPIRFVGVWDTVDAVGFPVKEVADFWNETVYRFKFPNHTLSPWINKACHALSIDDERRSFHPLLFNESDPRDAARIEQVWFAGVHANVGGGYPKQGLAHVALIWMMAKAEDQGLRCNHYYKDAYLAAANIHDKLYDSRAGLSVYYSYAQRDIKRLCSHDGVHPIQVHISTFHRILARTEDYAPGNLAKFEPVAENPAYTGQNPIDLARLTKMCSNGWVQDAGQDYDQSRLATIRRSLHLWFTVASLAVIAAGYLYGRLSPVETPANPLLSVARMLSALFPPFGNGLYRVIFEPLLSHFLEGLFIVLIPIYLYIVDSVLKGIMQCRYQRFWRRTLADPWWGIEPDLASNASSQTSVMSAGATPDE